MVLVQSTSKKEGNCSRDGCNHKTIIGKPYVWDTDKSKAYCSKECAEMATGQKVAEKQSGGQKSSWTPKPQQLWRTPEEAAAAIEIWHNGVVPKIKELSKAISDDKETFFKVSQMYQEIFLGKFNGGSKN